MATQAETTLSATEFKAKCLDLMNQVSTGKLRRVHVTKRGKPFVAVTPDKAAQTPATPSATMFGCLKGSALIPPDLDLTEPMYTDAELDGFLQDTIDQIDEFARRLRD